MYVYKYNTSTLIGIQEVRNRHWLKVMQVTGCTFQLEGSVFCLESLVEAGLLKSVSSSMLRSSLNDVHVHVYTYYYSQTLYIYVHVFVYVRVVMMLKAIFSIVTWKITCQDYLISFCHLVVQSLIFKFK